MIIDLLTTSLVQGLLLSCVACAVMISFRLLHLQDITVEGAYPLGGAIAAQLLLCGYAPGIAVLGAMLGGGMLGVLTSLVHLRLKIHALLAGIIVNTMAYSVSLRIMGKPNLALFSTRSLFVGSQTGSIFLLALLIVSITIALYVFLQTEYGLRLRAVGLHPSFARRQGIPVAQYICLGMGIAGILSGLGGSLMVQMQRYMDIGMGVGVVIHALAALMLGEAVIGSKPVRQMLLAPVIGSLIYQQLQGLAFMAGLMPSDIKFFTGLLVLAAIAVRQREA